MIIDSSDFFVAGGTMRAQSPSYVTRPADSELLNHLLAGEFCYVLTARQMGKSSLMVRTAQRLQEQDVQTAIIDLTSIGTVAQEAWYLGLLSRLRSGLRLSEVDVQAWWQAHAQLSAAQRFTLFLRDVVLAAIQSPVVIFIDEIDATLGLTFRDDFFAALRAIYNARANEPVYNRLTFALFGVATPTDLIQDRERTPFNIGHRIDLQEFTYNDAKPLRIGLDASYPDQGEPILQRIFFWTNGHPYLTQKLCAVIAGQSTDAWDNSAVDQVVEKNFFSDEGRKDTNLTFVQDRIAASPELERRAILTLYRQVHQGKFISDDDRSPVQNRLELYGLLRVDEKRLQIRNELYRRVFNADWINANTPVNTQRQRAILAVGAMLLLVVGVVAYILNQPNPTCDTYTKQFNETKASALRIDALAGLFNANCRQEALTLFYALSPYKQEELFLNAKNIQANSLITTIEGVYVTLDTMPEPERHDLKLMSAMVEALKEAGVADNDQLVMEIMAWHNGREQDREKNYQGASDAYATAIDINPDHPVTHYDRAMANVALKNYDSGLKDLDEVIRIAQVAPPTPTPTATSIPSSTPTSVQASASTKLAQQALGQITPNTSSIITTTTAISSLPPRVSTMTPTNAITATGNLSQTSRFMISERIIQVVKKTIEDNSTLLDIFNNSSISSYTHLASIIDPRIKSRAPIVAPLLCTNISEIPKVECEALVMLYNSTDGPNWITKTNWLVTNAPCSWFGVTCDGGRVTKLILNSNRLNGVISPELGGLSNLIELELSDNQLNNIPPALANLTKLTWLILANSHLTGNIPSELGKLVELRNLDLSGNQLSGNIPSDLGKLDHLEKLHLHFNQLSGTIPLELTKLTKLRELHLIHNKLIATDPALIVFLTEKDPDWAKTQPILSPPITTELFTSNKLGDIWFNLKDEANYVYVPDGKFTMGNTAIPNEMPTHTVKLDAFWIMQTEVTNAEYARCVTAQTCTPPANQRWNDPIYAQHPVTNVNWNQANQYAEWVSGRLPTEAEWEKAARGTDQRSYPWGNTAISDQMLNYNDVKRDTTPVGSYPAGASPYGALDMAGNAEEWVSDWYSDTYYANSPLQNPLGPATGVRFRVTRGGSYGSRRDDVRTTVRGKTLLDGLGFSTVGFRVVLSQ